MSAHYAPDWSSGKPRLRLDIRDRGETYLVDCPFCTDTRHRLYINHRWAVRDSRTGDDNFHLAFCFNEGCLATRENQKKLHALVYPHGHGAGLVDMPVKPSCQTAAPAPPIVLPPGQPLCQCAPDHPARQYLLARGFNPDSLGRTYGVIVCDGNRSSRPHFADLRIVIPIYEVRYSLKGVTEPVLAGWQARMIDSDQAADRPKYLTAAGMKKSCLLYGLPLALTTTGRVVVVEGITDAWRVGTNALAMLGKTISPAQCALIVRHFAGRPIVVWLDSDAQEEAAEVRKKIQVARCQSQCPGAVLLARMPPSRKDPGECTEGEIRDVIGRQ
jgi:hypothetical protein